MVKEAKSLSVLLLDSVVLRIYYLLLVALSSLYPHATFNWIVCAQSNSIIETDKEWKLLPSHMLSLPSCVLDLYDSNMFDTLYMFLLVHTLLRHGYIIMARKKLKKIHAIFTISIVKSIWYSWRKKTQIKHEKCTLRWWVGLRLSKRERERKHWDLLKRHWDQAISNWAAFPINCTLTLAIAFEQIISAINGVAVTTFGHRIFCIFMTKIQKTWAK